MSAGIVSQLNRLRPYQREACAGDPEQRARRPRRSALGRDCAAGRQERAVGAVELLLLICTSTAT